MDLSTEKNQGLYCIEDDDEDDDDVMGGFDYSGGGGSRTSTTVAVAPASAAVGPFAIESDEEEEGEILEFDYSSPSSGAKKGKAPEGVNTDSVEKASNKKGSDSTNIDLKIPEDKSLRQIGKKLDRGKAGSERKPTRQNRHQPKKSFRPFVPIPASVFDDPKMFERDLEDLWRKGKAPTNPTAVKKVVEELHKELGASGNPYFTALHAWINAFDFGLVKDTLSSLVIKSFKSWLQKKDASTSTIIEKQEQFLNGELKKPALEACYLERNLEVTKLVHELFQLSELNSLVIRKIKSYCQDKRFEQAARLAIGCGIHDEFSIHDFAIPLILYGDGGGFVRVYLAICSTKYQEELIAFFDSWINGSGDATATCIKDYARKRGIEIVETGETSRNMRKKLVTTLTNLAKDLGIGIPKEKYKSEIRFLIYKRGDSFPPISGEGIYELVEDLVRNEPDLIRVALDMFVQEGYIFSSAKLALSKEIPQEVIPNHVQRMMKLIDPNCNVDIGEFVEDVEEDWGTNTVEKKLVPVSDSGLPPLKFATDREEEYRKNTNFYSIRLPSDRIRFVDSANAVDNFLLKVNQKISKDLEPVIIAGFDSEWKCTFRRNKGVALIQVALRDEIFLIDVFTFQNMEDPTQLRWTQILNEFFANMKLIKLGYGVKSDTSMLSSTCSAWANIQSHFKPVLDLEELTIEILKICPTFFPYSGSVPGQSSEASNYTKPSKLAGLVHACFNAHLDKAEQTSNWERRPLRPEQISYAAADAFVLIDIYDFMDSRCRAKQIDFNGIVRRLLKIQEGYANDYRPATRKRKRN